MYKIEIEQVGSIYVATLGCKKYTYLTREALIADLSEYLKDTIKVEKAMAYVHECIHQQEKEHSRNRSSQFQPYDGSGASAPGNIEPIEAPSLREAMAPSNREPDHLSGQDCC